MKTSKAMNNRQISKLLDQVAAALTIKNEDRFKIMAYANAADAIARSSAEARDLWEQGKLMDLPGIGKSIDEHLSELFRTGRSKHFAEIFRNLPEGMFSLLEINGVGPKTAYKLAEYLGLSKESSAVNKLKKAVAENKIAGIEGFGKDSQERILAGIAEWEGKEDRMLLPEATELAGKIINFLRDLPAVEQIEVLGSLRRRAATVGDIDIAVATNEPEKVIRKFLEFPEWNEILANGENMARARHRNGRQVDLKTETVTRFGALLQHYTGSKSHNIKLREYALTKNYSLSEHGIKVIKKEETQKRKEDTKTLKTKGSGKLFKFGSEKKFYEFLGMEWIPPELREGEGEIEASLKGQLPKLLEFKDMKGDFHIHSNFNIEPSHDLGTSPLAEIMKEAERLGYEYIAISDHNPAISNHSEWQIIELIKRRNEYIDQFISSCGKSMKIKIFKSLEIDILPDGERAIPDAAMDLLDMVMVSVHSSFREGIEKQTQRVLNAMDHPKVKMFGHPTGRQLLRREGVEYDWKQIFEFCRKNKIWLEINANPQRLDLPDRLVREAIKSGVLLALGTDSHAVGNMKFMPLGADVARRGWAERKNIVNTIGYNEIIGLLNFLPA